MDNGFSSFKEDAPKPRPKFQPSKYQQAIFDFITNGQGSAIVEAVAGSGKTTTVVDALDLIPSNKRCIFLAFNKSIADELRSRVPSHTVASTFHSAGLKAWGSRNRGVIVNDKKVWDIVVDILSPSQIRDYGGYVSRLVGLAKQVGIGCIVPDNYGVWSGMADHHDLRLDGDPLNYAEMEHEAIEMARHVLGESNKLSTRVIDYNDMIYMPILENIALEKFDYVFIDEAQDTNNVRRELAARMLASHGRVVAVGDSHQAIYGFTGASTNAMDLIANEFSCQMFPLSISYRCSKAIVLKAKEFVPNIESSDTAPQGSVSHIESASMHPGSTDAILCRNTAPLVELAYELIGKGTGCRVLGSEIGKGLIDLINKMKTTDIDALPGKLNDYQSKEVSRLIRKEQEGRARAVVDKVKCIDMVISHLQPDNRTINGLVNQIQGMFTDNSHGMLTLSTIHKAKGLEWDRVFIYRPELMPCPWAKQDWEQEQEKNVQYVAITRARKDLYFVS